MAAVGADAQDIGDSLGRPPLKKLDRGGDKTSSANALGHNQIFIRGAGLDALEGRVFVRTGAKTVESGRLIFGRVPFKEPLINGPEHGPRPLSAGKQSARGQASRHFGRFLPGSKPRLGLCCSFSGPFTVLRTHLGCEGPEVVALR